MTGMSNEQKTPWYSLPYSRDYATVYTSSGETLIATMKAEHAAYIVRCVNNHDVLVSGLEWVIKHLDDDGQYPGHDHKTPGIWDDDNSHANAGKPCAECFAWSAIKGLLSAAQGEKAWPKSKYPNGRKRREAVSLPITTARSP